MTDKLNNLPQTILRPTTISDVTIEDSIPNTLTNIISKDTQKFYVEKVQLTKNQKRRINDNKKKREFQQVLIHKDEASTNPIDIKKKTIPPLGKPITFEGLDFSNDPFKDKRPLPKCVVKCDDEIFKSIEPIIQQLFGQL